MKPRMIPMSSDHRTVVTVPSFLPVPVLSRSRTSHIQGAAIMVYLKLRSQ